MVRSIFRDNRLLFGPLRDADMEIMEENPRFGNHGIAASGAPGAGVEVYATFPADPRLAQELHQWYLANHSRMAG